MEIDHGEDLGGLADYVNVPPRLGMVISAKLATMAELNTVLSLEDLVDLVEIMTVDAHNQRVLAKRQREKS